MDFIPDLGEPGIFDELFYFGPLVLQVIMGALFLWVTGRWLKGDSWWMRILSAFGMVLAADFLLLLIFAAMVNL